MRYLICILFLFFGISISYAQTSERMYLTGKGSDDANIWEFYCTGGMQSGKWTTIQVPSCWELQGFGKYDYGYAKDSERGKETGIYKTSFVIPSAAKGKRICLNFEGVMTDAIVVLNGKNIGSHQGAFYAFSFDVTDNIIFNAPNKLEVRVHKHSNNASVNAAERKGDFWIFGGIFRPVYLEWHPQYAIDKLKIDAKADGSFVALADVPSNTQLYVELYDAKHTLIGRSIPFESKDGKVHVQHRFDNIKNWNPESPNLYTARFILQKDQKTVHLVEKNVGFRTIEIKEHDGIYLNNVRIKLKGVNRHSFRPESGRTTSRRISIEDAVLMKEMNMNAVRMSHYPPDDHFLDICDSIGLLVLDELAGWHGYYDDTIGARLVSEMLIHDANHPSILMWVNGNEGGHNRSLDRLFGVYDLQQRHVIHAWENFNGFDTQHYREFGYGVGNFDQGKEIVMPTEFLHGQFDGGHGAGLEDYWEYMWREPLHAGGFLWDFADQAVMRKDLKDSLDTDKHRAADGILGPHLEKEGSFYAIKQIWSPVFVERKEITPQFNEVLNLENRYHFTNLNTCTYQWQLKRFEIHSLKDTMGTAITPSIEPGAKGSLDLNLPKNWATYDVLYLTIKDKDQRELFTWSFPITSPAKMVSRMVVSKSSDKINLIDQDSSWSISIKDSKFSISKKNGLLSAVSNSKGSIPFSGGPVLQEVASSFGPLRMQSLENGSVLLESTYSLSTPNTIRWILYPTGWVQLEVSYFPVSYFTNFLGINFNLPESEIKSVRYMGDGPYRVWKNRLKGTQFGVWEKTFNRTETGEYPWVYPEFKGYHAHFYGGYFFTQQNAFTVVSATDNLFLRLYTPAWKTDQWHNYEPLFPSGDISFLNGISSIGSKTQRNETTGPMGSKNIYYDYEKDPSRAIHISLFFNFSNPIKP